MKRVLITSNLYLPNIGGIENSLYYLAKAGVHNGDQIVVVTSDICPDDVVDYRFEYEMFKVIRYKVSGSTVVSKFTSHILSALQVYRRLRLKGIDATITRYHLNTLLCYIVGLRGLVYIVPGVVKYQSAPSNINGAGWSVKKHIRYKFNCMLQYVALRVSSRVLVFSENMKKQVQNVAPKIEVELVSPGIDFDKFRLLPNKDQSNIVLLIVARLNAAKNVFLAIRSLKHLSDKYMMIVVGDGPCLSELRVLARKLGVDARIKFEGSKTNVVSYYDLAHIFLMPSTYEPFGQTILEASSAGLPTVGVDSDQVNTATVKILSNLGNYSYSLDPEEFSKAIELAYERYYLADPDARNRVREFVLNKYSWHDLYLHATRVSE